jgi:hypothetical protein
MKCRYCDGEATKTLVWLKDKQGRPARIKLPWCGCDLMTALRRIWASPYQVIEGRDYEVIHHIVEAGDVKEYVLELTPDQLRAAARCLDSKESEQLKEIADLVERNGSHTVMRPAHRVTWRNPNHAKAAT